MAGLVSSGVSEEESIPGLSSAAGDPWGSLAWRCISPTSASSSPFVIGFKTHMDNPG